MNSKSDLKKNASLTTESSQNKPTHLKTSHSTPPNISLQASSNPSGSKAVRSSLLRSMEMICVTPNVPPTSPLQQSFLGNIYRNNVAEGGRVERNSQDGQDWGGNEISDLVKLYVNKTTLCLEQFPLSFVQFHGYKYVYKW